MTNPQQPQPSKRGTLREGEPHPATSDTLAWLSALGLTKLQAHQNALSSCAIEGNRLAEVCAETLRRLLNMEPVVRRR